MHTLRFGHLNSELLNFVVCDAQMSESPCHHNLSIPKTTLSRGPRGHFRCPTRSPSCGVDVAGALPVGGSRPLASWRLGKPLSSGSSPSSALT